MTQTGIGYPIRGIGSPAGGACYFLLTIVIIRPETAASAAVSRLFLDRVD